MPVTSPDTGTARDRPSRWLAAVESPAASVLRAAGYSEALSRLLARRGVQSAEQAKAFLEPEAGQLLDPEGLHGLAAAVGILGRARDGAGKVMIVGDYDVDGVSSAALVLAAFGVFGIDSEVALPHRVRDGYGLQTRHVERALEVGATVLLTLDCGTTSHEPIALAVASGLEVVVVDHHLPGDEELPQAVLVNPKQPGCSYLFPDLCAAGLALKLVLALGRAWERDLPLEALLRVACLGTIADMVPLRGENRVIAALGLDALARTRSVGLRALFRTASLRPPFEAADVGFRIGPRINAAGRLGSAEPALELLLTRDEGRAAQLASHLEQQNSDRRAAEATVVEEALERVASWDQLPPIIVEWSPDWHRGVVGIAASRLARRLHRPTILLEAGEGTATGSGRSIPGVELFGFLAPWRGDLVRFGGHAQAVGMTVSLERLEALRRAWVAEAERSWSADLLTRVREYELEVAPAALDFPLWRELSSLAPFGVGNPRPLLKVGPLECISTTEFSKGHLKAETRGPDGTRVSLLAWSWAERIAELESGPFEALGHLGRDRLTGACQLELVEVRSHGQPREPGPRREGLVKDAG